VEGGGVSEGRGCVTAGEEAGRCLSRRAAKAIGSTLKKACCRQAGQLDQKRPIRVRRPHQGHSRGKPLGPSESSEPKPGEGGGEGAGGKEWGDGEGSGRAAGADDEGAAHEDGGDEQRGGAGGESTAGRGDKGGDKVP
jgi:hypothetical protein